jgi:hypothetical protein
MTVETMPVALSQVISDLRLSLLAEINKGGVKSLYVQKTIHNETGEVRFTVDVQR